MSCTRPGIWGNPYVVVKYKGSYGVIDQEFSLVSGLYATKETALKQAIKFYKHLIARNDNSLGDSVTDIFQAVDINTATIRHHLSGKHLSCWCKAGEPCHVQDVLLLIINNEPIKTY